MTNFEIAMFLYRKQQIFLVEMAILRKFHLPERLGSTKNNRGISGYHPSDFG